MGKAKIIMIYYIMEINVKNPTDTPIWVMCKSE